MEGSYVEMHIYSPQTNWNKVIECGVECLKGKSLKDSTCKLAWGVFTIYGVREK